MDRAPVAAQKKRMRNNRNAQLAEGDLRDYGESCLYYLLKEFAANGLKTPRSLRGETIRPVLQGLQTLSHGTKLLQLYRKNVRRVQGKEKNVSDSEQ